VQVRDGERDPGVLGVTTHLAHTRAANALFSKSFHKSQFSYKSVNLFFILVIVSYKLTDLWGS